jgi:HEAT repeat protein
MGPAATSLAEDLANLVGTEGGRSSTSLKLALAAIGESAVPHLIHKSRSRSDVVRRDALVILWKCVADGTRVPVEPLSSALSDSDTMVRRLAVQALRDMRPRSEAVVAALGWAERDEDDFVREVAENALREPSK